MGLQVRLRHAMGERVLDIPATSAHRPFVLGRGPECNFVVPSMTVALRQCVIFVQDGRWVVQDWTRGATKLNGRPLGAGATPLSVGDVLTIGNDTTVATLEIDPGGAAVGRKGTPALDVLQAPAMASGSELPRPRPAPASAPRPRPAPLPRPRPAPQMPAVPVPSVVPSGVNPPQPTAVRAAATAAESMPSGADAVVDWGFAIASADATAPHQARRRKKSSPASMVVAIVLGLAIVGATAWFASKKLQQPPPVVVIQLPPAPHPIALPPVPKPSAGASDGAAPTTAPANSTVDDNDPPDPHAGDPDWPDILIAHDNPDQGVALLHYDDYRRRNPGKNDVILRQYETEALDRMWWQRIVQLCHRRDRLTGEITEKDKAIATESDPSFKTQLQTEKAALIEDRKSTEETLHNQMGFAGEQGPDLNDDKAIDAARASRNADKFADWSRETANYVRRNNGSTPWGNEDL